MNASKVQVVTGKKVLPMVIRDIKVCSNGGR